MSRTGHHSVDGVRAYKRVSDEQRQALSDVLNTAPDAKKPKLDPKLETDNGEQTNSEKRSLQITGCYGVTINYCMCTCRI